MGSRRQCVHPSSYLPLLETLVSFLSSLPSLPPRSFGGPTAQERHVYHRESSESWITAYPLPPDQTTWKPTETPGFCYCERSLGGRKEEVVSTKSRLSELMEKRPNNVAWQGISTTSICHAYPPKAPVGLSLHLARFLFPFIQILTSFFV